MVDAQVASEGAVAEAARTRLHGTVGTAGVVFMTLALMSPLTAAAGYTSVVIAAGGNVGAPLLYLLVGIVMALFGVGYLGMVRDVARPGGLYTLITVGLGKRLGLGGGFVAMAAYLFAQIGLAIFGGQSLSAAVLVFGGPEIPWFWIAALYVVLATAAAYFNIGLSVKLLSVILVIELLFIVCFNVAIATGSGASHWDGIAATYSLAEVFKGAFPIAFLFAFLNFMGFESPSMYYEEVKNPRRTVPRATYLVIAIVAIMYSLVALMLVVGYGKDSAVEAIAANTSIAFQTLFQQYLGNFLTQFLVVSLQVGIFASVLSGNNVLSRYIYNNAVDGVLPKWLGRVQHRTGAPSNASIVVGSVLMAVLIVVALTGDTANVLFVLLTGISTYGFLLLFFVGSIAIVAYFVRRKNISGIRRAWTLLATGLAGLIYGAVLIYVSANLSLLIGDNVVLGVVLQIVVPLFLVVGIVWASVLARVRPQVFARIGREVVGEGI